MWFKSATIVRTLPFAIYILFLALNNSLALLLSLVIQDIRWIYGVRVGVVALILAWFWRQYSELSHLNQSSIAIKSTLNLQSYAISLAVGVMVFVAWIAPYPAWAMMSAVNEGFNPISADGQGIDIPLALTRIAGAALVVPIMEELFWRSFLMRWLQNQDFLKVNPAIVGWFAFLSTAGLFAIEHSLWLAGLLAGLAYGWLYKTQRNLWSPIIAHATTNGLLGIWVLYTADWRYW